MLTLMLRPTWRTMTFDAGPDFEESGFADFAVGDDLRFEVL